ncbi:MAG: CRISPR system precrRNA processing endoribonuclease RAMP protein Cas6 [Bacteroidetes bacterium]|jgi:hypothetical protein|nr:CRISPR system precrRNA processing endoribonuclease RAMP protein Cas6 [Bacteroidota bacterium]
MTALPIHTYRFDAIVTKKIDFRYFPGFVLRNALLRAMEELYCTRKVAYGQRAGACEKCPWLSNCIYRKLNLPVYDIPEKVAQAYLINPEGIDTHDIFPQGSRLSFQLSLFGHANQYAEQWIEAVRYLGSQMGMGPDSGRFELQEVSPVVHHEPAYIANNEKAVVIYFPYLYFFRDRNKIPREGMDFSNLIAKVQSRYTSLCSQYGQGNPQPAIAQAEMPQLVESHFHISRLLYPPGGSKDHYDCFKGRLAYAGNLAPFEGLLRFGSQIGIGQFTVAGLGRFRIFSTDSEPPVTH